MIQVLTPRNILVPWGVIFHAVRLFELFSPYGNCLEYWDAALSSGRRINILATSNHNDFKHSVVINAEYIDKEQIINSLKNGDFYAISYKNDQDLPVLKNLILINDTISVSATKTIKRLLFIGQDGIVKDSLYDVSQGFYVFQESDTYIRTELHFENETTIYLNPIIRHQYQYFFDPVMSEIMKEKTWLMRIIFVAVIIFFIKFFFIIAPPLFYNYEVTCSSVVTCSVVTVIVNFIFTFNGKCNFVFGNIVNISVVFNCVNANG